MIQSTDNIKITTSAGDTFDELALTYCGSELLSSEIIALNPDYSNVIIFGEGVPLLIPVFDEADTPDTLPPWRTEDE